MAENDRTTPFYKDVQGFLIPGGFSTEGFERALKYVPRDNDLFIATYPKCGTTWVQQIVYLIFNKGAPETSVHEMFLRTPFLDMMGVESVEQMPHPGAIKTHLPFHLTPYSPKAKYLCIVRNPKDVAVSYFHHMITDEVFTFQEGTFDRFFDDFVTGRIAFNDYFHHVLSWYEHRNDPNVLVITYEELKKDTSNQVLKIAEFMGKDWFEMLSSDEEMLDNVLRYSSFDYMKSAFDDIKPKKDSNDVGFEVSAYPALKYARDFCRAHRKETDEPFRFVRQGKIGGWRDVLNKEQLARLAARIEELKGTDLYDYWKSSGCI